MVRYFYAWAPFVIVTGTAVLLTIPYLALIALMIVALVALAAFAWAIVAVPYMLGRAVSRHWQNRTGTKPRTAPAFLPERRQPAQQP
jgi:hypothetical protein